MDIGERLHQAHGVRMDRAAVDIVHASVLYYLAGVHHRYAIASLRDDRQVVSDEHHRQIEPSSEFSHGLQDLGLHHHVQGGSWFIRDYQTGMARQRHGDDCPLLHAPAELVRILPEPLGVDADQVQKAFRPLHGTLVRHLLMLENRLDDLLAHSMHRVKGIHRALKYHGYLAPSHILPERLLRHVQDVLAVHGDDAAVIFTVRRQQPQHSACHAGFAAPGLPSDSQSLSTFDIEAYGIDRPDMAPEGPVVHFQVSHFKQGHGYDLSL